MDDVVTWLGKATRGSAGRLIGVAVALLVLLFVVRWARRTAASNIVDPNVRYHARKVIGISGLVVAVAVTGAAFSESLAGLSVFVGVAVGGVAFALQDVIASIAGWITIASGGIFDPGDRVELGGVRGDVIDVGVLRTTLMEIGQWVDGDLYCGRIVRVGNSAVLRQPVFNYSAHFPFVWDEIKIPVQYGGDRARARRILEEAATAVTGDFARNAQVHWSKLVKQFLIEDAQVAPMVSLMATDNWLEYTVRYPVDLKRRRVTRDRLFEHILNAVDLTRGSVEIASTTMQIIPPSSPPAPPAAS